jgi:hypothetical protein
VGQGGHGKRRILYISMEKEMKTINWGQDFCIPKASAVKRVQFVSDRMSHIVLKCHWCNTIDINVHVPSDGESDHSKDSFYEELQQIFYHFPKYHI